TFRLQHDVDVRDRRAVAREVKEQRGGNVVWQIANDPLSDPEPAEIKLQCIALMDRDARAGKGSAKSRYDVTVDLDDVQVGHTLGERPRERTETWPDFCHAIVPAGSDCSKDGFDHCVIGEKVLAEALARAVRLHDPPRRGSEAPARASRRARRASIAASLIASMRLPALALPLPASASAVPWSTEVRMIGNPSVTLTPPPKAACFSTGKPWS